MDNVASDTNESRKLLLEKILNGSVNIVGGNMRLIKYDEIFDEPCNMRNLVQKFGGSTSTLGSGSYGTAYELCLDERCKHNFALKKIKMSDDHIYGKYDNPMRPENVEVEIFKLLNAMLYTNASPHIPYYMGDFICEENNVRYRYYMSEKADGNFHNLVTRKLVNEKFINGYGIDLVWKVLFFQILSTLGTILIRYPNFRHNDLHIMNVLYFERKSGGYFKYRVGGIDYFVPNIGFQLALWDFDFSIISGYRDNVKVYDFISHNVGIAPEKNEYHDLHKFFNSVLSIFCSNYGCIIPETALEFIYSIIPKSLRGDKPSRFLGNGSLLLNYEFTTPSKALQQNYFNELRQPKKDINIIDTYVDTNILKNATTIKVPKKVRFKEEYTYADSFDIYIKPKISDKTKINKQEINTCINNTINTFNILLKGKSNTFTPTQIEMYKMNIKPIKELTTILLHKYLDAKIFPSNYLNILCFIVLLKATLYLTYYHFFSPYELKFIFKVDEKIASDLMIQFDNFMIKSGLEKYYQTLYKLKLD